MRTMKKILILLAVATLTANLTGCYCCRGLRNWFYQGAYCGPAAAPLATMTAPPQYCQPTAAPMMSYGEQECSCGTPYVGQAVYDAGWTEDGCAYQGGEGGVIMQSPDGAVYPGPAE